MENSGHEQANNSTGALEHFALDLICRHRRWSEIQAYTYSYDWMGLAFRQHENMLVRDV